ncbi:CD74 molecule, major histocompatibility complex, class II invariant chain a [Sinocyclocheilus rhinocerous]|uniref:H-2 class II histocompatibility antigen gamma chain-like n=1 Tax=Sinocyclocheilus rhinocerous TaxID=307959 RepID=A0A673G809_9TELE|nr:PREDICTED: H-2 class II histocompatibility antigen gamma chain-like [Sinocyclocheilus rhinocerous]XP_016417013.1 PREDICTED: H-2 class II histocompatibility antigen gamma chain-like [Sinocyclocheilus rhinocerous]
MDEHQDRALIQRMPSQETVLNRGGTGSSNGKALKVAGLTVLACLLLAGQALTAYLVWGQKEHISALTTGQEKLKTELTRKMSGAPPKAMHLPMKSMPLLKDFSDESSDQTSKKKSSVPLTKLQPIFTNQREGSGQLDASRLMPKKMQLPMRSLPLLVDADEDVKSSPESAVEVQSKCQLESQKEVRPGFYKSQCDKQGNYLPMQCWHSTGYCWCVDKDGKEIPDTRIRGRPECS